MKQGWVLRLLCWVGAFLAGLCLWAPASLMSYLLAHASEGVLTLSQTRGSLWSGSGVLLLHQPSQTRTLGNCSWEIETLAASLKVQGDASVRVHLAPLARRIDIDGLALSLPAAALVLLAPQLAPYQLQGTLEVHSDHLQFDSAGNSDGLITMDWHQAASALSSISPLGDYQIRLQAHGAMLEGELNTLSGKLQLNAKGSFNRNGEAHINGTAQSAPDAGAELDELLHHMGPEIRPGIFSLGIMPQSALR